MGNAVCVEGVLVVSTAGFGSTAGLGSSAGSVALAEGFSGVVRSVSEGLFGSGSDAGLGTGGVSATEGSFAGFSVAGFVAGGVETFAGSGVVAFGSSLAEFSTVAGGVAAFVGSGDVAFGAFFG